MTHIPHSTHDDEARFIIAISGLIMAGDLPALPTWETSLMDEKSKLVRKKQGEKEAKEAENLARELGVWDEFYGSGKPGERKSTGKGKGKGNTDAGGEDGEDHSALQALILKKKQKSMDGFFEGLVAKYAESEASSRSQGKGKKREREQEEEAVSPKKKSRRGPVVVPEINDEEFEKLQQKLFGDKAKSSTVDAPEPKQKKRPGRKAK
jgi:DnaJ family protein C protein 9